MSCHISKRRIRLDQLGNWCPLDYFLIVNILRRESGEVIIRDRWFMSLAFGGTEIKMTKLMPYSPTEFSLDSVHLPGRK